MLFDLEQFDISWIIKNFNKRIIHTNAEDHYYYIIKELAKLNRVDLKNFKERFTLSLEKAKSQELTIPYRMTSLTSGCGYVFIPCLIEQKGLIENALKNFTNIHMYDQKLDKAIGMITYFNPTENYHDILWIYIDQPWT